MEGFVMRAATDPPTPLINARLEIDGVPEPLSVARTDASGRFVFEGLPAGRYRLRVTKDGFLRQEYPHAAMGAPGIPIVLAAGQEIRNIVFWMEPARTISGVIRDSLNAPIADVLVQALRRGFDTRGNRTLSVVATSRTDDKGSYRLYWLDPGEYFIAAIPPRPPSTRAGRPTIGPTYFPGFTALDDAKPIRLDALRDANGLDFALTEQILGPVHGSVISLTTGRPVTANVFLKPVEDGSGIARFQTQSREGPSRPDAFNIPDVPPGSYILSAVFGEERGARRISVRGSGLISNLELSAGAPIRGRFFEAPAGTDFRGTRVAITEIDTALPQPSESAVTEAGAFSIAAVQPGYYSLSVTGFPGDLYMKAAVFAGTDALEKPITFSRGADPAELAIQVGVDGGRVAGTVLDTSNKLFAGAHVTLIPSDRRSRLDLYRTTVALEDGSFSIRGIAPGDYKLFAWVNPESNAYLNVEYMRYYEDFGTPVRIAAGENAPLSLRAITIER